MGRVISTDTQEGASTPVLTETGQGGLFSTGYLRDDPAGEYVGDGETVAFVVTNADRGVVRERANDRTEIRPGGGYRTIGVVTDRRVIVLVGDADDGDERVTLPLIEIADASPNDGDLVVEMRSGERWLVHTGDGGIEDVATYVRRAARTWNELESELDAIKRTLVAATAARDEGEYRSGIEAAQSAYDRLDEAATLVADVESLGPAGAMAERIDHVRDRCVQTLADVRLGHGRAIADDAEERWRDEQWEAAFDAYERARAEFEAVAALDANRHDESDALERELARIEQATERLAEAPLQRAIDADRRTGDVEDPARAIADWRTAREWYEVALLLDEDEPARRFAGDPEKVEARLETVTDRILETATDAGAEAKAAGTWYLEADRPRIAREELLVARSIFEDAVAVAREARPAAVTDLEEWLADTEDTLEAATEAADLADEPADDPSEVSASEDGGEGAEGGDGASKGSGEAAEDGSEATEIGIDAAEDGTGDSNQRGGPAEKDEPTPAVCRVSAPAADGPDAVTVPLEQRPAEERLEAVADAERTARAAAETEDGEAVVGDGAGAGAITAGPGAPIPVQLRALDPAGFDELVHALVETMGWTPEDSPADAPFDLRATREDPEGSVVVRTIHRPMAGPVDADQVEDATALHDEVPDDGEVMLVTSSGVTEAAVRAARDASVRLIDEDYIVTVLSSRETDDLLERIRPRPH